MTCIYCDHDDTTQVVPAVGDDEAWTELAKEHADDCEWILTRAHRRPMPDADDRIQDGTYAGMTPAEVIAQRDRYREIVGE